MADETRWGRLKTFWRWPKTQFDWAIAVSLIWLGVQVLIVLVIGGCTQTNQMEACLSYSEVGDLLAGLFAPLAFGWLAFGVYLQTEELRAQRQELQQTRQIATEHALQAERQAQIMETEQTQRFEEAAQAWEKDKFYGEARQFLINLVDNLQSGKIRMEKKPGHFETRAPMTANGAAHFRSLGKFEDKVDFVSNHYAPMLKHFDSPDRFGKLDLGGNGTWIANQAEALHEQIHGGDKRLMLEARENGLEALVHKLRQFENLEQGRPLT